MSEINILSPHVADLIAAGEVVERPASVIKELMENSFDAGARAVTVEFRDGGATYLRVTDDGKGMAPEDAGVAFLRHATSKLSDEAGLEAIETMGFRGEALAAVSAVSEIELYTRRRADASGTHMTLSAGDIRDMREAGCPAGTSMQVKSLFFNTPARLKFLKSDRAEASACVNTALRCALGRPEISVRLVRDGKEEFFTPGDGKPESAVYSLLGRELASELLPCAGEDEKLRVHGFVSSPSAGRGSRAAQYFFCNGRSIRSQLLQTAVEQAYRNTLLTGRYPACVLWLELSCGSVDVNVHPAKTEVKFSQEKRVFDLVYHAVLSALQREDRVDSTDPDALRQASTPAGPELRQDSTPRRQAQPRPDFYRSMSSESFRAQGFQLGRQRSAAVRSVGTDYQTRIPLPAAPPAAAIRSVSSRSSPKLSENNPPHVENSVQTVENVNIPDHKIVGEALKLYILVELGDELLLIDKHAAHERMIFDRLKAQPRELASQTLLESVTLRLTSEQRELAERYAALLDELGFELAPFGERDYILRAVPADMAASDARAAVEEILDKLGSGRVPDPQSARDEILHTVACKAAIKAGWDSDPLELQRLVDAVLSGQIKYCPHGRPVSAALTRRELDKLFKRIV